MTTHETQPETTAREARPETDAAQTPSEAVESRPRNRRTVKESGRGS